ncbi:Arachidonate 8S-lipoxygenase [Escovopsis weberi]|uniref:Manganese lipoxygenase n=1 Tax=Escovopsis weberi TaxID=150374 RepID=A0A0M8MVR5_ESCWE|nr:Arachidonate 8S-lipoxygenase [Escovopsis weberi]
MRSIEDFNADLFKNGTDIKEGKNIGMFKDWYSDRRFADQAFTGVDPTTIKRVSDHLLKEFGDAAIRGGYDHWAKELPLIKEELFVTDCSYLREAVGAEPQEELVSVKKDNVTKWANASVTLYRLQGNGQLHPVAIVIDYKGSMRDSVTIFNKAKESLAPKSQDGPVPAQEKDWPWRYAKMCAQASSYVRHEIGTHLTLAHFVEEALIIATNRTIPENHRVYQLLEPHWDKTIAINTAGRAILVPSIIQEIVGLKEEQLHSLIRHEYTNMHYTESYVPNDLRRRGFPDTIEGLKDPRYRDYAYAKGALHMWDTIKCHVESVLRDQYKGDADNSVATDKYIADWCREMQEAAHIPSFPTIKTLSALVDAVTMAIHIAGPFHSAVNYLQNFYLAFVPSRPPALSATLPSTLEELRAYGEADVVQSLPMHQLRHWLLAMQVPWLLSFKVSEKNNIKSCTEDRVKLGPSELLGPNQVLFAAVKSFDQIMKDVNEQMNPGSEPYTVLDPKNMAKSALI